mgnify:CR=1 FL=1
MSLSIKKLQTNIFMNMKQKFIALLTLFTVITVGVNAQVSNLTPEQIQADKETKLEEMKTLQEDIDKLDKALATMDYSGWKFGGNGNIAFSGAGASNWQAAGEEIANGLTTNIGVNLFANMSEDKFYWFNGLNVQLGYLSNWTSLKDLNFSDVTSTTLDKMYLSSLPGYRINSELAATGLLDVQSSLGNFGNPAAISGGIGITWTPIQTMDGKLIPLKVVFHPITWKGNVVKELDEPGADASPDELKKYATNQALRNEFGLTDGNTLASEFGLKVVADYGRTLKILGNNIGWTSQVRVFAPYTQITPIDAAGVELPSVGNVEFNWDNAFSILLFKNLAVSANWNLRQFKPETNFLFNETSPDYDPEKAKHLQQLWNFGFGLSTTF